MAVLTGPQVGALLKGAGFTGQDVVIGIAVAKAESNWRTDAVNAANRNGSVDRGLMQINSIHRWATNLFDPVVNVRAAKRIFDDANGRWQPWSTFNAGRHLPHMAAARQAAAQAGTVVGPIGADPVAPGDGVASPGDSTPAVTYGAPGPQQVLAGPSVRLRAQVDRPGELLGSFRFFGARLDQTVYEHQITGSLDFEAGVATVPNLSLTILDPDGELFQKFDALWYRGTSVTYFDMTLKVNEVKFEPGSHGSGQLVITLIDRIVFDLFMLRGPRTEANMDAVTWLASELKLAKLDPAKCLLGEATPSQSTIARDSPDATAMQSGATPPGAPGGTAATPPGTVPTPGVTPGNRPPPPVPIGSGVGADTGTLRFEGTDGRLAARESNTGADWTRVAYIAVPATTDLRRSYLVRNRSNNASVVATGGVVGGYGGISLAAARALNIPLTAGSGPGDPLAGQNLRITDFVPLNTATPSAPTGAQRPIGSVVEEIPPDVAGTTPVPGVDIAEDMRSEGKLDSPSSWSTQVRLAKELGKRCFISGNRIVFGSAGFALQWIRPLDRNPIRLGWNGIATQTVERFLEMPTVTRTAMGKREGIIQIVGKVDASVAVDLRPGSGVSIVGIPGVRNATYMVQKIKHSLGVDFDGAEIELVQPVNPPPEPPQTQSADPGGGTGATGDSGLVGGGGADGQIDAFVNLCLAQEGDRYIFGAEVRMSDPNPSVFDCCLAGDTLVETADGDHVRIDELTVGRWVRCLDRITGTVTTRPVLAWAEQRVRPLWRVHTTRGVVDATDNHPFLRQHAPDETEWCRVEHLTVGATVVALDPDTTVSAATVLAVEELPPGRNYDIEVAEHHNFVAAGHVVSNSELIEWAAHRTGIRGVPDGSSAQIDHCTPIPVEQGKRTRGALLWHQGHIAVSLGDGNRTIEAQNSRVGVVIGTAGNRFKRAGKMPNATGYR